MNIPYSAVFFAAYETLKAEISRHGSVREDSVGLHLMCGAAAGVVSAAVTNPLDVAKTRLQTQHDTGKRYTGLLDALSTIYKEEGVSGIARGMGPRVLLHSVSSAIVWATYEYMKNLLAGEEDDPKKPPEFGHVHAI